MPDAAGPVLSSSVSRMEEAARPARPLRVLWCIKCLGFGGAERLLASAARRRDREQFHYEAAYILPAYNALAPELEEAGVPVHLLGSTNRHADLRWLWRLRQLLLAGRYDIVHLHLPYMAALGRVVVRTLPPSVRPKLITSEHNLWKTNHLAVRLFNSLTMPLDDANIAVSRFVKDALPARHRRRFEVVVHGVLLDHLESLLADRAKVRADLGVEDHEVLIGTVANFRAGKGYDRLLHAAKELLDRGLPVRFAAVGQGPLEQEIRKQHQELGLGRSFQLLGFRADALRVLAAFDIFVLASLAEGFPISVMEALGVGVPVVATAVGGVPDAVTNGREGLVVDPANQRQLVEALAALVEDPQRRARMASAALAKGAEFDITAAVRRTEEIYRHVVGLPARRRDPQV